MTKLKILSGVMFITLTSCAHAPHKVPANLSDPSTTPANKSTEADPEIDIATLDKNCETKNAFACMARAEEYLYENDNENAFLYYQKGCDLDLPASCSEASVLAGRVNRKPTMMKDALKSCRMNSTLGCYNVACYKCSDNQDVAATQKYLLEAIALGFADRHAMETDPDLACIKDKPEWAKILAAIPVDSPTNKSQISGLKHIFYRNLGLSFIPVPGFKFEPLPGLIRQTDSSGAQVTITGVSIPFKESSAVFQQQLKNIPSYELLKQVDLKVNGFDSHLQVGKYEREGLSYYLINYFTGNDDYTAEASGTFLAAYQGTFGDAIQESVTSIVLSPTQLPSEKQVAYDHFLKGTGFKFAGIGGGQVIYNTAGELREEHALPVIVINPVVFGIQENKLDSDVAKSILEKVASGKSATDNPKAEKKLPNFKKLTLGKDRFAYEISTVGADGTGMKAGVQTLGVRGKKLMPGLVWTMIYDDSSHINVQKVLTSLRETKIKPDLVKKFHAHEEESLKAEEEKDSSPSLGTGALHEG
jgi:hypothetical protein